MPNRGDALGKLVMAVRQALLMMVDAIEVYFNIPRTSEMRKKAKVDDKDYWRGEDGHI